MHTLYFEVDVGWLVHNFNFMSRYGTSVFCTRTSQSVLSTLFWVWGGSRLLFFHMHGWQKPTRICVWVYQNQIDKVYLYTYMVEHQQRSYLTKRGLCLFIVIKFEFCPYPNDFEIFRTRSQTLSKQKSSLKWIASFTNIKFNNLFCWLLNPAPRPLIHTYRILNRRQSSLIDLDHMLSSEMLLPQHFLCRM